MASLYLNGSTINSSGKIEIPVIGEIYLLGQDLEKAKRSIQKAVDESNNDHLQFMINHFVENNNLKVHFPFI